MASSVLISMALAVVLVGTALFQRSEAAPIAYTVGDADGWTVSVKPGTYQNWANSKNFSVGDALVFNFRAGEHDVAQVSEKDFNACTRDDTIVWVTDSPANIRLVTAGMNYFICTKPGHCAAGQKLKINVLARAWSNTNPGTETLPPPPPAAAKHNSAPPSSMAASAGLFAAVLASIASFLY